VAKKKKYHKQELVLYGVLSYPDLANPKPFKGKVYYKTDVLFDQDDPQIAVLKKKLHAVRVKNWGEDKTEWPEKAKKRFIQDGNEREDQPTYQDKVFISVSTQSTVHVIDTKGKAFAAAMVKGGMFAKVAVAISPWENEGEEGLSIYLQAVMVDTSKEKLPGFGGGKSAHELFGLEESDDDEDSDDAEDEDDEDDVPRGKKKKKPAAEEDDEDADDSDEDSDDDEDDYAPVKTKKKKKKPVVEDDDEDEDF